MKALRLIRHCLLCLVGASTGLSLRSATAAESPPSPRSQVLFMGTDLSVSRDKKLYRVEDVQGSEFKIRVDGKEVLVPTRLGTIALHVDADLKVSGLSVQLDQLQSGPAYTYANDPMRKLEEANRNTQVIADLQDLSAAAGPRAEANLAAVKEMTSHYTDQARAAREVNNAEWALQGTRRSMASIDFSVGTNVNNLGEGANKMALAEGNFDAMEVSFKVSSPIELDQPYMVILFKFHDPSAKAGVNGLVIHAEALDPIGPQPRFVRVLRGGLPPGFKFVDCAVHLYNRGQELATNTSENRVELTRDQARQFLVLTHLHAHKEATLPAAAVPGALSRAQREGLARDVPSPVIYAKVASDGSLLGIFKDAACQAPVDEASTTTVLGEVFFTPALDQGKPVDGVARVRISGL